MYDQRSYSYFQTLAVTSFVLPVVRVHLAKGKDFRTETDLGRDFSCLAHEEPVDSSAQLDIQLKQINWLRVQIDHGCDDLLPRMRYSCLDFWTLPATGVFDFDVPHGSRELVDTMSLVRIWFQFSAGNKLKATSITVRRKLSCLIHDYPHNGHEAQGSEFFLNEKTSSAWFINHVTPICLIQPELAMPTTQA